MSSYGTSSKERLATCSQNIQAVMYGVIECLPWTDPVSGITIDDCTIIEGHRNEFRQNYLYDTKKSKARYPDSRHNKLPSDAVDAAPYHATAPHIHWNDKEEFIAFGRLVKQVSEALEINIRSGTDWNQNGISVDKDPHESFFDGPHHEEVL